MESSNNYISAIGFGFIKDFIDKDLSVRINFIDGKIEIKGFGKTDFDQQYLLKLTNYNQPVTLIGIAHFSNDNVRRFSASFSYFSTFSFPDNEGYFSFVVNPTWIVLNDARPSFEEIMIKKAYFNNDKLSGWTNSFHKKFDVFGEENPFLKIPSDREEILLFKCDEYSLSLKLNVIEKTLGRHRQKIEVIFDPFLIVEFIEPLRIRPFLILFHKFCDLLSTFFNEKIYVTDLYVREHLDYNIDSLELLNDDILISKYSQRETFPPKAELAYSYVIENSAKIFSNWNNLDDKLMNIISLYHLEFCKKERNIEESFTTFCSCIELLEGTVSYLIDRAMDIKKKTGKKGRHEPSIFYYKLKSVLPPEEISKIIFKKMSNSSLEDWLLNITSTRDYFHHRNKDHNTPLTGVDLYRAFMQLKTITLYHLYTCFGVGEKEKLITIDRTLAFMR